MLRIHKNLEDRNSNITQKKSIKPQKEQQEERKKEFQNQLKSKDGSGNKHIITLNVNRLSILIKRHRMAEWITKQEPTTNDKCWKGYREKGTLVGMQIVAATRENSTEVPLKTKNCYHVIQQSHSGDIQKR